MSHSFLVLGAAVASRAPVAVSCWRYSGARAAGFKHGWLSGVVYEALVELGAERCLSELEIKTLGSCSAIKVVQIPENPAGYNATTRIQLVVRRWSRYKMLLPRKVVDSEVRVDAPRVAQASPEVRAVPKPDDVSPR